MTDQDFDFLRGLLKAHCAVHLEPGKQYLVESRLAPIVHQMNLGTISDLVRRIRAQPCPTLSTRIVEALMTKETSFFRDQHPFDTLRKTVLPELLQRRGQERTLNIWCAACSTGQEPYSLAILIREHFPELAGWKVKLLASDLSGEVLARAREGKYHQLEINRGLPLSLRAKYFEQHGSTWQLSSKIRGMVEFQEINLVGSWPVLPRMDLVLLRNVMIYFDVDKKKAILNRIARVLRPDGYLLLGGAESTINLADCFRRREDLKSGFYYLAREL